MNTAWHERWAPWLVVSAVLLVMLPGTAVAPLVDRDEPRFATATREMIAAGEWIVPTFNGAERFDKPILTYWLMRAGYALAGVGELGARLHSVAATLALALLAWHAGRRWYGPTAGLVAGLTLATCLQVFVHGRLAVADMPMVLAVAVAQVALAELLLAAEAPAAGWWWALWLAVGLGFLTKGPIALAVPALSLILFRWALWRQPLPWSRLGLGRGLLLALTLVAAWGVPALMQTEGRFFAVGIGEHVVKRGLERFNGRGYSPLFYLQTAPLSLFPWIAGVGLVWRTMRERWNARTAWLAAWLAAPYLIFTGYATQLPHYVLPAFPAYCLLLAQGTGLPGSRERRWGRWFLGLVGLLLLAALVVVLRADLPAEARALQWALAGAFVAVLGLAALPVGLASGRPVWAGVALLVVAGGATAMGSGLRDASATLRLMKILRREEPAVRFVGAGLAEPSLVFYSDRPWRFVETETELATELARPGPVAVVSVARECDPLDFFVRPVPRWTERVPPPILAGWVGTEVTGLNVGRSRWQAWRVWRRP